MYEWMNQRRKLEFKEEVTPPRFSEVESGSRRDFSCLPFPSMIHHQHDAYESRSKHAD
jgi:hypothetical protein